MSKPKKNTSSIFGHIKQVFKKPSKSKPSNPKSIRVNRSVPDRIRAHKDARARRRADYLATLPKNPIARFFYRFKPSVMAKYWFSKQGLIRIAKIVAIGAVIIVLILLGLFAYFRKDLPKSLADLKTCSNGASTTYYDRTGQTLLWSSSGDVECYPVKFDQLSPFLKNSVVASEDKDFYKHGAFSFVGIARAGVNNFTGGSTQGGSTITQQFVKNSLLTQDRTVGRKIKEIILATEVERGYSKDEILNAYLNEISFGSAYDGAEAASRGYFNKSAKDLTLEQAALLTAVIPAPTYYSPYGQHTDLLIQRQHIVLDKMVEQGYVTQQQADDAKKVDVLAQLSTTGRDKYKNIKAPYFVLAVREQLEAIYGANNINKYGYKVITTLDLRLQELAEEVVAETIPKVVRNNGQNMAVVAEDTQTGQVLAEVGGRDFNYPGFGQLNMATTPREPGSTMKPYNYAALMTQSKNWGAGSTIFDTKTDFGGGYIPNNFDKRFPGATSMRKALGGSRNIPALKAMYMAGIQNTFDLAKKMGLVSGSTCEPNCYLSAGIGGGSSIRLDEHVNAFSTFSRMGKYKPQTYILKVEDSRGKTIKEWKDTPGEQVLDPQIAYTINDMLSDPKASYFGNNYRLNNGFKSAMKTGTTDKNENSWLMGYTPNLAFGIWTGRQNDINGMYVQGEVINGPAWNKFMTKAHEILGIKGTGWTKPSGMKTVCINQSTGYATTSGGVCDIFPSWYNPRYPGDLKSAVIDTVSSKLATECTPEAAKKTITGGGILSELPTSDPMYKNWIKSIGGAAGGNIPTDKDDVHSCDPADKPTVSFDTPIANPDGTYTLTATVTKGKYPVTNVSFKIDGNTLPGGSFDITDSGTVTFKYSPSYSGPKDVVVEVTDNVLFSNSDTKSVNFTTPTPSP